MFALKSVSDHIIWLDKWIRWKKEGPTTWIQLNPQIAKQIAIVL